MVTPATGKRVDPAGLALNEIERDYIEIGDIDALARPQMDLILGNASILSDLCSLGESRGNRTVTLTIETTQTALEAIQDAHQILDFKLEEAAQHFRTYGPDANGKPRRGQEQSSDTEGRGPRLGVERDQDILMRIRDIAEKVNFIRMKLQVISQNIGENPIPDFPHLEGLECILDDQIDQLKALSQTLFTLSGGKGSISGDFTHPVGRPAALELLAVSKGL